MNQSPEITQITKTGPYWIIEDGLGRTVEVFNLNGRYFVHDHKSSPFSLVSSKQWKESHKNIQIFNKKWW